MQQDSWLQLVILTLSISCVFTFHDLNMIVFYSFDSYTVFIRLDALALSVIATATWLAGWVAGWLAVTLRYCIKTAKPIGKLF